MRIFFYLSNRCVPTKGGTERTTVSVASALASTGQWECFSAYHQDDGIGVTPACFSGELQVDVALPKAAEAMAEFARSAKIDVIVVQGQLAMPALLRQAGLPANTAIVFGHHFEPGWEEHFNDFRSCSDALAHAHGSARAKAAVKVLGYPVYRVRALAKWHDSYRSAYEHSDRVVLLSEGFAEEFQHYGGFEDSAKFAFIPNPLSSTRFLEPSELAAKEKVALIVARFDETQKKITLALKAWELVKRDPVSDGWTLRLVGHGRDEALYRRMVERRRIPAVEFAGRRDPIGGGDYSRSRLFLMSSVSEGWGLTLTEAQQFGCVPVAFDSYASVRDIVTDGRSGLLVPYPDVEAYAAAVLSLMADRARRERMALAAVEDARRYTQDRVAARWLELLEQVAGGAH